MRSRKKKLESLWPWILMAFALIATAAPVAQAQAQLSGAKAPAFFTINLNQFLLANFIFSSDGYESFLFPGLNLTIRCDGLVTDIGKLSTPSEAPITLLHTGCLSFNYKTGAHLASCTIINGKTITTSTIIKPVAHGEGNYLLADLITVPVQFHKELGCPLASFEGKGSLAAEVTQLEGVVLLANFSESVQSLLGDTVSAGSSKMYFDADVLMTLVGTHQGYKLGVHQSKDLDLPKASSTLGAFTVAGSKSLAEERSYTVPQAGSWRLAVPGLGVDIKCNKIEVHPTIISSTEASDLAFFRECALFESGTENLIKSCVISSGTIVARATLLPVLHNGETYVLIEAWEAAGEWLATVSFKSGLGCALPLSNKVEGTTAVRIDELELVKLPFAIDEEIQLLAGGLLRFSGSPAYPEASSEAWLDDSHEGLTLGVH